MVQFEQLKAQRMAQLEDIAKVAPSAPRLVGWAQVVGGARTTELGYDPDSEATAVSAVLAELERLDFDVDDRQTAGVGYDLLARHRITREQRLIEVKGFHAGLEPVWLEQHEWAQAQQRGQEYWLYVVTDCASSPDRRRASPGPSEQAGGRPTPHREVPDQGHRPKATDGRRAVTIAGDSPATHTPAQGVSR